MIAGTRSARRKGGAKPVDMALLRELFADRRTWVAHGLVVKLDGEDSHFEIDGEDVLVDVQLADSKIPVLCRLGVQCGGSGVGIYSVPPVGTEVGVLIPKGEIDGEPIIIATLSTGKLPDGVDDSGTIVICVKSGAKVLIHDGSADDCKQLATKDDVDNHTHDLEAMQVVTTSAAGTWDVTRKPPVAGVPKTKKPPAIDGTQVLKAK